MSVDISWLWDALNSVAGSIQSFFSSLWEQIQGIANAGQGLFAGLSVLGSTLWNAIVQFGDWLYKGLVDAWNLIQQGLSALGEWFWKGLDWIGSGIAWIGSQIYAFGNWLYNGILWVWNLIASGIEAVWNAIVGWFYGALETIWDWIGAATHTINQWFTNIMIVFRQKFVTTVMVDLSIYGMWKSAERVLMPKSSRDIAFGLLGLLLSPAIGYTVGKMIDIVVPKPSTAVFPVLPELPKWSFKPPEIAIPRPAEKPYPPSGRPERFWSPVEAVAAIESEYEVRWTPAKVAVATIESEYEVLVGSAAEVTAAIDSEYEVTTGLLPHATATAEALAEVTLKSLEVSAVATIESEYEAATSLKEINVTAEATTEVSVGVKSVEKALTAVIESEYSIEVSIPSKEINVTAEATTEVSVEVPSVEKAATAVVESEYNIEVSLPPVEINVTAKATTEVSVEVSGIERALTATIESEYEVTTGAANASGIDPNDPKWAPADGWTTIWEFETQEELEDFADYKLEYASAQDSKIVFDPPDGSWGNAWRDDVVAYRRFAVCLKVAPVDVTYDSNCASSEYEDCSGYLNCDVWIVGGAPEKLKLRDDVSGASAEFSNPNDWFVVLFDLENRVMRAYDRDGNVLAEQSLAEDECTAVMTIIRLMEGNTAGYRFDLEVDWVAVKE